MLNITIKKAYQAAAYLSTFCTLGFVDRVGSTLLRKKYITTRVQPGCNETVKHLDIYRDRRKEQFLKKKIFQQILLFHDL